MNPIRLNTNACWLPSFPRCCWNMGFMSRHKNSNWVATGLIIHLHSSKKTFSLKLYSGKCRKPYDMGMLEPNDCICNLPIFPFIKGKYLYLYKGGLCKWFLYQITKFAETYYHNLISMLMLRHKCTRL